MGKQVAEHIGYAVYFYGADEFSIERATKEHSEEMDASAWFPTFTEAKRWSRESVRHAYESYRRLLGYVHRIRKSEIE